MPRSCRKWNTAASIGRPAAPDGYALRLELDAFVAAVLDDQVPPVTGEAGREAVVVAHRILRAIGAPAPETVAVA